MKNWESKKNLSRLAANNITERGHVRTNYVPKVHWSQYRNDSIYDALRYRPRRENDHARDCERLRSYTRVDCLDYANISEIAVPLLVKIAGKSHQQRQTKFLRRKLVKLGLRLSNIETNKN